MVWAARRVGRPVKWTGDRTEAFLTDYNARDVVTKARLGFNRRGRILAMDLELTANTGAHTVSYVPLSNGYRVAPTVYDVPVACVRLRAVMTNTVPTAPFRGAGRPEATSVMERMLDIAARRLKIDRVELRRRNLIAHDKLPHRTATGLTYDSGDVRRQSRARAGDRRLERLRQPPHGSEEARPPARHRHRQLCRDAGRHAARARQGRGLA